MFHTFLVNLDRSADRLVSMREQAERVGLTFERLPAVLGTAVPEHLAGKFFVDGQVASELRPGEVGCYASHLLIYEKMIERGLEHALVLEDDAILAGDIVDAVERTLSAVPAGWDIIKICNVTSRTTVRVARVGARHLVRYVRQPFGTFGYLVSAAGARKMLTPGLRTEPIDMDMRRPWRFGLETYGVLPPPVQTTTEQSEILDMGGRGKWAKNKKERNRQDLAYTAQRVGWPKVIASEIVTSTTKWLPQSLRPRGRII